MLNTACVHCSPTWAFARHRATLWDQHDKSGTGSGQSEGPVPVMEDPEDPKNLYEHVLDLIAKHGAKFTVNVVVILLAVAIVLSQCGSGS